MALPAKVKGYIKDANGVGIVAATAVCAGVSAKTIAGGAYVMFVPATGVQKVTGSLTGRNPVSVSVTLTEGGTASAPLITLV